MKLTVLRVQPTGHETTRAFVDGRDPTTGKRFGGLQETEVPVYPPSPRGDELRLHRQRLDLDLCTAATRAGMKTSEYCGLEQGSHTLGTNAEWNELERRVLK